MSNYLIKKSEKSRYIVCVSVLVHTTREEIFRIHYKRSYQNIQTILKINVINT